MRPTRPLERWFWSACSRRWDDLLDDGQAAAHIAEVVDQLAAALPAGARVVDLGCGTGNHSIALAQRGFVVTGVDLTPGMLDAARGKGEAAGLDVTWVEGDLSKRLPLPHAGTEAALSVFSAQFVDLEPFLAEVRRVVAPGGSLLIEVPRPTGGRRDLSAYSARYRRFDVVKRAFARLGGMGGLVRRIPPADLRAGLQRAGFEIVDERTTPFSAIAVARR